MPEQSPRQRIFVDVDNDDETNVKIKWRKDLPWGAAYRVPRGMLEQYSATVRNRVEALVIESMKGNVKLTGAILKEIAEAGNRLYRALFHDPNGPSKATKMRDRLKNLSGEYQLSFSMGTPLHVPWGLVYDGDPDQLSGDPADIDIAHYRDFWCVKYSVASVYSTVDPEGIDKPLSAEDLRVHAVVNQAVFTRTRPYLVKSATPSWDEIEKRFGPPIFSQKAWLKRWATEAEKVGVLYFYSHANGNNIGLGIDNISANDLSQDLSSSGGGGLPCLVFLNGCSTAVGNPQGGFLEATAGSRFCGFIGAEASVPEVYALHFGSAFLYEFLRGRRTLLEVMDVLRKQHWPLSLLYNMYCVPDLSIMPEGSSPPLPVHNYCDFDLGSQGI